MKYFKRNDYMVITFVVILGFASLLLLRVPEDISMAKVVNIYSDNRLMESFELTPSTEISYQVTFEDHVNMIEIRNGEVYISHSDCPDQICVKDGPISKNGEILVCLPHKMLIEIVGKEEVLIDGISQ